MPQQPLPGAVDAGTESSILQLIRNGRTKTALENAKEAHRRYANAASEALLLNAYAARVRDLASQGLTREAAALWDSVRERFPQAVARIGDPLTAPRPADRMAELLAQLAGAGAGTAEAGEIEKRIAAEAVDLEAIARSEALPEGHSLRVAAAALSRAFMAVTTGPVEPDALVLNEVSRRSPLAAWKSLILAIHHFYRRDDAMCLKCLEMIPAGSAALRMAAFLQAVVKGGPVSNPKAKALATAIVPPQDKLRQAIATLDKLMRDSDGDGRVLKQIRAALEECRHSRPDLVKRLMQHISVHCSLRDMEVEPVRAAMGGPAPKDAGFYRLLARAWETDPGPRAVLDATAAWAEFQKHAISEGLFSERGPENAVLYLHMADVLRRAGGNLRMLPSLVRGGELPWFCNQRELYERACGLDPTAENFSRWLAWAREHEPRRVEGIAELWSRHCPSDVRPLILMMDEFEGRNALAKAMQCLQRADAVDSLHPAVRAAHVRIILKTALRHLQKRQEHLVEKDIAQMEALPQLRQGDRAALAPALRYLVSTGAGRQIDERSRAEVERQLGGALCAEILLEALAHLAKRDVFFQRSIPRDQMDQMPQILARSGALLKECDITFRPPKPWLDSVANQLRKPKRAPLSAAQLSSLGDVAVNSEHWESAYAVSVEGLKLGGDTEGRFLLLRARAIPGWQWHRRNRCAAAALKLASQVRDQTTVDGVHDAQIPGPLEITKELVELVRAGERKASTFPTRQDPGPDYRRDDEEFQRAQAEAEAEAFGRDPWDEFDDEEGDEFFDDEDDMDDLSFLNSFKPPKGVPKEVSDLLLEAMKQAIRSGKTPQEFEQEFFGQFGLNEGGGGRKKKKRR